MCRAENQTKFNIPFWTCQSSTNRPPHVSIKNNLIYYFEDRQISSKSCPTHTQKKSIKKSNHTYCISLKIANFSTPTPYFSIKNSNQARCPSLKIANVLQIVPQFSIQLHVWIERLVQRKKWKHKGKPTFINWRSTFCSRSLSLLNV